MNETLTVYIGYDSADYGQYLANIVCIRSMSNYAKLNIKSLVKKDLEEQKIFDRDDSTGSTEFTYTRFLVPYLNNYQGYAIFCDSDFLWNCDPSVLLQYIDPTKAISCVQHEYTECPNQTKMDGLKQEWYPRKNWSSLIVFNCAHPSCRKLTPETVNTQTPKWLHRMEWAEDEEIGSIPHTFNYLVGYYHDHKLPKAIHYTDGGPWYKTTRNCEFANLWINYLEDDEKKKLFSI